jgi:FeS assembly SUF system protein
MTENPKASDYISSNADLPEACAETVASAKAPSDEPGASLEPEEIERLTNDMVAAIKTVYDPEIPVDIYELGLIYKIDVDDDRNVEIDMTLTAPACPVAGDMPVWVENAVSGVPGIASVHVNLVFDPPWDPSRMSEEAQIALNMF